MGKSVRKNDPVTAEQLLGQQPGDPIAMDFFKSSALKQSETEVVPKSTMRHFSFDPHAPEYEYIPNATPNTTNIDYFNNLRQSTGEKAWRGIKRFGANVISSFGQGLANTLDLASFGKTVKGEITGSDDEFESSIFGLTTKEMQDWADGVANRNRIFEEKPGSFDLGNFGWWSNQFASAGTGVGMALEALATTVLIEGATGGAGTGAALTKLGRLFSNANKAGYLKNGLDVASGLKSAATLYGTISRYSESRMEASQSYEQIYNDLSDNKNPDGSEKFTEEEKRYLASEGARRTFNLNMALLPLDIIGYRTMVYNPVSGTSRGLIERGLGKIGNKWARRGVQATAFAGTEGIEEGLQFVAQEEGEHYAKVLGGMDDGTTFGQRFGKNIKEDEFWNSFAGGVIGAPIIAGAMKLANKAMQGNSSARLNAVHEDYIKNVAKMDNITADSIKKLQAEGREKEADVLRRQFRANKALSALHLDALTDKDSAFDSHISFLEGTLDEVNQGNFNSLIDLGFAEPNEDQIEYIKQSFKQSIDDAQAMKSIYDNVKEKFNKNFVPQITMNHFQLQELLKFKTENDINITEMRNTLPQFGQLSSYGQQLYDAEYKLESLMSEQRRLTDLFRATTNTQEKENISQLIETNKAKLTLTKESLNTINKEDAYTEDQRSQDADILSSALRDRGYAQLMRDKEHLDNAIALKRKNLALWNNPEYLQEKTKESISKAKTKANVENTEQELQKNGQVTSEVQQSLKNKKDEIAAQEAAQVIKDQQESQQEGVEGLGNSNLFEEDNELINSLKEQAIGLDPENPTATKQTETYLLSPSAYDFEKSSDDAKAKVINGVRGLLDKIGNGSSFEDLVRHVVKVQGTSVADEIFNALKYGWTKNGLDEVDFQAVYNKVFGNPMDELLSGVKGLIVDEKKLEEETKEVTDKVVAGQQKEIQFDNNNQPRYDYKGYVTNESSPKMAFVTRLADLTQTIDEEGNVVVSYDYTSEELNQGDYVESLQLLDPDKFDEGTEMVIKIPMNFNEIKVPVYNPDGTKGQAVPFGQYVAMKGLTPEMQEYQDKIPMIIYKKGATGKGVALVHDIGWYHPLRFNQDKKGDMEAAITNTREIRSAVLQSTENSIPVTITSKRQTTFAGLKTKPNETISLKEANPQTIITVALTTDSLSTSKTNTLFPNDNTALINNSPFKVGQIIEVRRYGKKEGKKTFIGLPVLRSKLDKLSRASVLQAINIYANRSNVNPAVREKHDPIVKQIQEVMGLDILNSQGLEKYLNHFIATFNTDKAKTNEDVESQARAKYADAPGTPFIAFIAGGNIVFGRAGEAAYTTASGKKYSYFINPNIPNPSSVALSNLAKPLMMDWYEQNVDLNNLNRNKPVVTIDEQLNVAVSAPSYNDFLLERLRTNVRSYNIGTEENPNYVTNIQPVITYELNSKLEQGLPNNTEVREEILSKGEEVQRNTQDISEIERQILEQAKRDLGSDFGISKDNTASFLPSASNIFGISRSLYNTSIDKVAYAIEQGVGLDEAIKRGVDYIKSNYGESLFELEYVQHLREISKVSVNTKEQLADKLDEIDRAYINSHYRGSRFVDFQIAINNSDLSDEDVQAGIRKSKLSHNDKRKLRGNISGRTKAIADRIRDVKNTRSLSPSILSKEQREAITDDINRIAGLTPDQQFDIVDFMYNQITAMVNLDNKVVSKAEVNAQVEKAFNEVIVPLKKSYEQKIEELNKLLTEHPVLKSSSIPDVLNDYQYRIDKINSIQENFDVLNEEAYNRVAKYTGITEDKVKTEQQNDEQPTEENRDIAIEEEKNEKERDFWTDVLTENPESRLSYSMRRFFGQIREYDKNGNPMTGFLGLPTYTGADTIIRTLMVTLADVPSDFDTMIAKLESRKQAIPWMQEVINKLQSASQQKKNQFVTVMSNTSLRMKFTMISYNRKTKSWTTKVFDTNLGGVANAVKEEWKGNFFDSDLAIANEEGNYQLNKTKAESLIHRFESWKGKTVPEIPLDMSPYRPTVDQVKSGKPVTFVPTGSILQWLKTNVVKKSDRAKFSLKGYEYQVTNIGDNKFEISFLNQNTATKEEVDNWLKEFGIVLTPSTLDELMSKGLYHNYQQRKVNDLFTTDNGLFQILYNKLKILVEKEGHDFTEYGDNPLDESVVSSLANLEAKYNDTQTPFGFRDNGKSLFALTAPKFITDRARDLKNPDSGIMQQLLSLSFSRPSLWLRLLSDGKFREKFQVSHMGLNAFKQLGKKLYRDNGITKLSDVDHELTKLGMFWDMTQGEVSYTTEDGKTFNEYPDTSVRMRMATMFSPTMSDKQLMTLITTAVLDLQNKDLNDGHGISDEVAKILYEQTVKPELQRMIKHAQNGGRTNISSYDRGASMFLFMPELNNLEYTPGLKLVDAIKHRPNDFTLQYIEGNEDIMQAFKENIKQYVSTLTQEKVEVWRTNGFFTEDNEGKVTLKFFDNRYINDTKKFRGEAEAKVRMAAMDFVVNSMISNANSFMLFAGDPAMYYKSKSLNPIEASKETFVNVGKRLANQIAPGTSISNSDKEKYIQLFLEDRKSVASNIEYLEKLLGKEQADAYRKIEGSDAQEYTTWKEHLDILTKLGKTPDGISDITPEEIQEARDLFSSGVSRSKLTDKQLQLIGKVMQPIKPVYTGQIYDAAQDVMRTVYIKSSSFPLIPQLTAGMEIDKLRVKMESIEAQSKMNVRASYQTANKVGSLNSPAKIWNSEGKIDDNAISNLTDSLLVLDRKNFRIQQEIPFKSSKVGEDKITLGTQLMKLLFGDEILNYDGYNYNGKLLSGKELHSIYNDTFIRLVSEKRNQLFTELGLDSKGVPVDIATSMDKLQEILKTEAIKRGYPLQDIQGLTLNENGEFNLPLWASSNSNRYESMLNAIVTNRLIRMKFPGNSFVVGSEEGFTVKDDLDGIDKSRIVFTSSWNGKNLQGTYHANGELKTAQVLVASKFKDAQGNLIDLFQKEGNQFKYVNKTDTGYTLKENMFDKDLLSMISFRIPTSGHQSASRIEIVGFLPFENGDLMIVPKNFTKQKGLDFDVDKENAYNLWNYMNEDGSFEVLQEKHRDKILLAADKKLKGDNSVDKLLRAIFGDDIRYTEEDIKDSKFLTKLNSKITEKLLQNELIQVNHSVFSNPKSEIQAKINKTLNTDFAEQQADMIDSIVNSSVQSTYWTPLSDEYQKRKMFLGASGKIGTGAYSLDVVFHSLAQQLALTGKPIELVEVVGEGEEKQLRPKTWKFGNIESTGLIGGTTTLDGRRTISEVQAERQNIAVDNEKLQIMGRVNLNDLTLDVDKILNMSGFDRGSDGNSISFLFLSQPIIKEFVQNMKNANSMMAEYSPDKEGAIFDELINKYDKGNQEPIDDDYWKRMSSLMTNENFINQLKMAEPDGKFQAAVLRRFMDLKQYGVALRGIQTTINTDSKGLGKSFFDVIEKRNSLNRLGVDTNMIRGASNLIGSYQAKDELTSVEIEELEDQGYVDIGKFMVKPDTLSGGFNIYGVNTAYHLWRRFFPYDATITNKAFSEILAITGSEDMGDTAIIERKQDIFRSIKKYFSASKFTGIIDHNDDINAERYRLYIDDDNNTSLAKYIKSLKQMTGNTVVDTFIKSNKLINRFEFDIQKNGQPSLIKYNNAAGEEFDEQYLYESLATLMEIRGKDGRIELPQIGNKKYTLDTLAQDLIAYSYLGNATQEAIQFTKYVPVSYLNQVGFSEKMRAAGVWLNDNPHILGAKIGNTETEQHLVSEFTMQYIQHNPERVRYKLDDKNFAERTIKIDDNSFYLKGEDKPIFVSVYDPGIPKGEKKFRLYWFDGAKYVRVPVLGTFGMDEYQPRTNIGKSIVNTNVDKRPNPQRSTESNNVRDTDDMFNLKVKDIVVIMKSISESNTEMAALAKQLLPYVGNIQIDIIDTYITEEGKEIRNFDGMFLHDSNMIFVNSKMINNDHNHLATIIVHEVVHALTVSKIKPFIETDSSGKVSVTDANAPSYVTGMVSLYNELRNNVDKKRLNKMLADVANDLGLSQEDVDNYYGYFDIYEFIAMALSNKVFQQQLSTIKYKQSGKSFLQKFKEIIKEILNSFGLNFDEDTAAAQALNSIFEIVSAEKVEDTFDPYQTYYDYDQANTDFLNRLDEADNGEIVGNLLPSNNVTEYIQTLSPLQKKCD